MQQVYQFNFHEILVFLLLIIDLFLQSRPTAGLANQNERIVFEKRLLVTEDILMLQLKKPPHMTSLLPLLGRIQYVSDLFSFKNHSILHPHHFIHRQPIRIMRIPPLSILLPITKFPLFTIHGVQLETAQLPLLIM